MMQTASSSTAHVPSSAFRTEEQRVESFGRALDAIRKDVEQQLGEQDAVYIQRIGRLSSVLEIAGRGLIHFSLDPVTFSVGVTALWAHKSLELMEIGHMALHGAYDKLPVPERYQAAHFKWKAPIDEASWNKGHNVRHHEYTNIAGRDPDMNFGALRLSSRIPFRAAHRFQPVSNMLSWLAFANAINLHVTGMLDIYLPHGAPQALSDTQPATKSKARRVYLSKFLRYYGREYVFFPMLAGPFFWKTLLGNALSEVGRDVYSAATIYCGHVGAKDYPAGTEAKNRNEWYVMQAEGARDVAVPEVVSIMCGALDRQIEHHLFPRLPPNRLREIAPRVKAVCEAHNVRYVEKSWPATLREVLRDLWQMASPTATPA